MVSRINSIEGLLGLTLKQIDNYDEVVRFTTTDDRVVRMMHHQDCCESVYLDEVHGDLDDLLDSPILLAEEVSSDDPPPDGQYAESYTWTFYKLATHKGHVTLRWFGSSNGYYSEGVSVEEVG